jgi:hypothetical protein
VLCLQITYDHRDATSNKINRYEEDVEILIAKTKAMVFRGKKCKKIENSN